MSENAVLQYLPYNRRVKSRIKLKQQFKASPRKYDKAKPIPPLSVVMVRKDNPGPHRNLLGMVLRVGYYSRQDGTNVIWLVYPDGRYGEATDHRFLNRHFNVVVPSQETDVFGIDRPKIKPLSDDGII